MDYSVIAVPRRQLAELTEDRRCFLDCAQSVGSSGVKSLFEWLCGSGRLIVAVTIWDEKADFRPDAVRSQVVDTRESQEITDTGNEED